MARYFFTGWKPLERRQATLKEESKIVKEAPLRVAAIAPKKSDAVIKLALPGEIQAEREAAVYARTSGYLAKWSVDIGDHVTEGQTLAVISSPEVDMQLEQSRAALKQAEAMLKQSESALTYSKAQHEQTKTQLGSTKAKAELATLTLKRYVSLRGSNSINEEMISEKEADDKSARSAVTTTQATINSAQAAVEAAESAVGVAQANIVMAQSAINRLEVLQSFEKVTAPFAGTITQRMTEVGSLVTAGSGSNGQALFHLANTDVVRVYVDVPQSAAPAIKPGQIVDLILREFPNGKFTGEVARTTKSIDTASRTLRAEVRVKNPTGELLRGMYTQVALNVSKARTAIVAAGQRADCQRGRHASRPSCAMAGCISRRSSSKAITARASASRRDFRRPTRSSPIPANGCWKARTW